MLNNVCLMGRLTADPELRTTQNGIAVCGFTLACNRRTSGEQQTADFIDCTAWRGLAEIIAKHKHKGDMLVVSGRIETRTYEDKQGNKRKAVGVTVDGATFVGSRPQQNAGGETMQQAQDTFGAGFVEVADDEKLPF